MSTQHSTWATTARRTALALTMTAAALLPAAQAASAQDVPRADDNRVAVANPNVHSLQPPPVLANPAGDDCTIESSARLIQGSGGDDVICATGIHSTQFIHGHGGNDVIRAAESYTQVFAGDGNDRIHLGTGGGTVRAGGGNDRVFGGIGNVGSTIHGEEGDDYLTGTRGNDAVYGGPDDDRMYGGAGNDDLYGGEGDDFLKGEGSSGYNPQNALDGGPGVDSCYGGPSVSCVNS